MRKEFLFKFHYAILFTFALCCVIILANYKIDSEILFIVFNSLFCITHSFVYLILGAYKEYKYLDYKMPKYMMIASVTSCIVGVLTLYVYFKLENNGFDKFWWIYDGVCLLGLILPIIIGYYIDKYYPKKEQKGPRFIVNR